MENTKAPLNFTLKPLGIDSIPQLLEIQEETFKTLPDKSLLRRNTYETLSVCFNDMSLVLGVFCDERLIAFGILYSAGDSDENLAKELDDCDDANNYTNAKLIIVRPQYRGYGLQKILLNELVDFACAKGFKGVVATVAPDNKYSLENCLSCGFKPVKNVVKYGGNARVLLLKYC